MRRATLIPRADRLFCRRQTAEAETGNPASKTPRNTPSSGQLRGALSLRVSCPGRRDTGKRHDVRDKSHDSATPVMSPESGVYQLVL